MKTKPDKEAIITRVRKILAKVGNGATEQEAETAIAMASKLLADNQLAMADVEEGPTDWVDTQVFQGGRLPIESKYLVTILQRHFFIRAYYSRIPSIRFVAIIFFGDPASVEIATWLWARLIDQYRDAFRRHRIATAASESARSGYYFGLTEGLLARLAERQRSDRRDEESAGKQGTEIALVKVAKRLDQALAERYPEMGSAKKSTVTADPSNFAAGLRDSASISLDRPIGNAGRSPLALEDQR